MSQSRYHFVLLIDDLEHDRRDQAQQIFDRYRTALDMVLDTLKHRASVHFLVNMLEAYYFADVKTTKHRLGKSLCQTAEMTWKRFVILKAILKNGIRVLEKSNDGGRILDRIDIERVLSHPDTCASLRTLLAWCVEVFGKHILTTTVQIFYDKYRLSRRKIE